VRRLFGKLDSQDRSSLILALAEQHMLPLEQVREMEDRARAAYERIQARLMVGSSDRAADALSALPEPTAQQLLGAIETKDTGLAAEIRSQVFFFEDLANAPADVIRQVVTELDPGVTALALNGASETTQSAVQQAVSARLRSVLKTEGELMGERSHAEIDLARETINRSMRKHWARR
jgi:flagellar motor switch protein FliG